MARVLTLTGREINWAKPPKATDKVMWSQRTVDGKKVIGSLRTICFLDRLNNLSHRKFGKGILVYQGSYNTGVNASAHTHDLDAVDDIWIPGVSGFVQQRFIRANGGGAYYRRPSQGFDYHIHYFVLPIRQRVEVSRRWQLRGFKVGYFVDGGWSSLGKRIGSSQIEDYYKHRDALADHSADPSWFPSDIDATIFNLSDYIAYHRKVQAVVKAA